MTDSNEPTEGIKQLLTDINVALREFFDVRRQRAENDLAQHKEQDALTARYSELDKPLSEREAELARTLRDLLIPNKAALLTGKLKSFSTTFGSVKFNNKGQSVKIADPNGFERQARKDRKLMTFGRFVRTWKPIKASDIKDMLDRDDTLAQKYLKFLDFGGGFEELFVQPKDAYLTEYDPNRLTAESVNLGRTDTNEDDTSPDA